MQAILQNPLEADDVGDQQVAAMLFGEVAARQDFDGGARPRPLLIDLRRAVVLVRVIELAGEQRAVERVGSRAVHDDVLTPGVEDVPVRIGEAECHIDVGLLGARLVTKDSAIREPARRAPRGFNL